MRSGSRQERLLRDQPLRLESFKQHCLKNGTMLLLATSLGGYQEPETLLAALTRCRDR